jgi:Amt family ammonium transporter
MEEIKFALDTFYAIMSGALVMWMAAGFTMLEAGLVQKKDVSEIVTKNLGLFSIASVMYLVCGFMLMYPTDAVFSISGGLDEAGEAIVYGILPAIGSSWGLSTDMPLEEIGMAYGMDYSQQADFFFQVVFVATAYVNRVRRSCWKNETNSILYICNHPNCFHLPSSRILELGRWIFKCARIL